MPRQPVPNDACEASIPRPSGIEGTWDVIIIGSGVGGAALALTLANGGLRVLMLEKGRRIVSALSMIEGVVPSERAQNGWWPHPITIQSDGSRSTIYPPLGCAVGGSSIHYAAALERMEATDFEPLECGQDRLVSWPVRYAEFEAYYTEAERLFGLESDREQRTEERLSEWDRELVRTMRKNGFRPGMLNVAMDFDAQCRECIGVVCARSCKADANVACLNTVLQLPNFTLLEDCEVETLQADGHAVRSVLASHAGRAVSFVARIVVLAAGALHSPQILLRSRSARWPKGLANRSGQVGRNLMFHTSDLYALWAPSNLSRASVQKKAISIRDFYLCAGDRLGYVQSMGLQAGRGVASLYLKDILYRAGLRNDLLQRLLVKIPSYVAEMLLGSASLFAAMSEDDPHPDNRIVLDETQPDGAVIHYRTTEDLRRRANGLHESFAKAIRPWHMVRLYRKLQINYGHACGTCRFGDDPASAVLDRHCRTHDLDNLYVVDASFMPRSGAANPSLTIAANALRVGRAILSRWKSRPGLVAWS